MLFISKHINHHLCGAYGFVLEIMNELILIIENNLINLVFTDLAEIIGYMIVCFAGLENNDAMLRENFA